MSDLEDYTALRASKKISNAHPWWHFIYGKETIYKEVSEITTHYWYICKKCKAQVTETHAFTTFGPFTFELKTDVTLTTSITPKEPCNSTKAK